MTTEKIIVVVDNEEIELTGKALTDFLADRQLNAKEDLRIEADKQSRLKARESALAKLSALGLTEEEIAAL